MPRAELVLTDIWRLTFWDWLVWEGEKSEGGSGLRGEGEENEEGDEGAYLAEEKPIN